MHSVCERDKNHEHLYTIQTTQHTHYHINVICTVSHTSCACDCVLFMDLIRVSKIYNYSFSFWCNCVVDQKIHKIAYRCV